MSETELSEDGRHDLLLKQALDTARKREFRAKERRRDATNSGFIRVPWNAIAVHIDAMQVASTIQTVATSNLVDETPEPPKEQPTPDDAPAAIYGSETVARSTPKSEAEDATATVHEAIAAERAAAEARTDEIREIAYAEGLAAGRAMTESARAAELDATLAKLNQLLARLGADDIVDTKRLQTMITDEIRRLAEERIGRALDEMPSVLEDRIVELSARVAHLQRQRDLYLAPEDHALVLAHVGELGDTGLILHQDHALARGAMRLRVGGIEIEDRVTLAMDASDD